MDCQATRNTHPPGPPIHLELPSPCPGTPIHLELPSPGTPTPPYGTLIPPLIILPSQHDLSRYIEISLFFPVQDVLLISAMLKVPDGAFSWKWFKSLVQHSDLNLVGSTWSPKARKKNVLVLVIGRVDFDANKCGPQNKYDTETNTESEPARAFGCSFDTKYEKVNPFYELNTPVKMTT